MSSKLFSGFNVSINYAKYRVSPPQQLITAIIEYLANGAKTQKWSTAVDVGCGTGQATRLFAPYFEHVYGFDLSETQIKEAVNNNQCPNIEFKVSSAESLPVEDNSVNLVTASEAFHYFDASVFYKEVERCLKMNGVLAIFGYKLPDMYPSGDRKNEKLKTLLYDTYRDELLAGYTDPRANLVVEEGYNGVVIPFSNFIRIDDSFSTTVTLNITEVMGLIVSWSAFGKCSEANRDQATNVLEKFQNKLKNLMGDSYSDTMEIDLVYNFILLMARKS